MIIPSARVVLSPQAAAYVCGELGAEERWMARRGADPLLDAEMTDLTGLARWHRDSLRSRLSEGSGNASRKEPETPGAWMTTAQAARRLQVTARRVLQLLEADALAGEQQPNGRWRISRDSIESFKGART